MHPFNAYTREVIQFRLGDGEPDAPAPPPAQESLLATLKALNKNPGATVCLVGLGDGSLAAQLDAALPSEIRIVASEFSPDNARRLADAPWNSSEGRVLVAADTSPWAHLLMWLHAGLTPHNTILRVQDDRQASKTLRKMFSAATPLPANADAPQQLSVGAILSPTDPGLDAFFAHIPSWIQETVVVWDAQQPPQTEYPCAVPVRHIARPLGRDFAAQRNAMLQHMPEGWCMVLDADERLSPEGWEGARLLAARADNVGINGFFLPRRTLCADASRFLVGYGLWPDLQPRLFRTSHGLRYERPIHERLTGIQAPFGMAVDLSISHLSHVLKTPEQLRAKLAGFDMAAQQGVNHRLSDIYPTMPNNFFPDTASPEEVRAIVIPFAPA